MAKGISNRNQKYVDCAIADLVQLKMTTTIFNEDKKSLHRVIDILQRFESD